MVQQRRNKIRPRYHFVVRVMILLLCDMSLYYLLLILFNGLGRRASIDYLKGNSEMTKLIENEVREIMAKKLSAGGVTSSDDSYDEDEGEGEMNAPDDEEDYQRP